MNLIYKSILISLLLVLANYSYAAGEKVGVIIFSIGAAHVGNEAQVFEPISKGQSVSVGQAIKTEQNGHVHIRFDDNAFVSVRSNSLLLIEDYFVDEQNPKNNRIKFTLKQGTSRLITGKGGQANKQAFRLNTPVAAIGVRGTDFVVQTDLSVTRVSVQQGGVAVSPLAGDCASAGLGPCKGDLVRDLMGSLSGKYLEVRGQMAAELIMPQHGKQPFALPRPEEPSIVKRNDTSSGLSNLGNNNSFMWGRWAGSTATPTGYELIGQNEAFALFRLTEQQVLPSTGTQVQFTLTDAMAYGRYANNEFLPASIADASFSVNFERREFATRFNWIFDGNEKAMFSRGRLSPDGRLLDDESRSNISFSGALSNNGENAAFIFDKRFTAEDMRAYGILQWTKQ